MIEVNKNFKKYCFLCCIFYIVIIYMYMCRIVLLNVFFDFDIFKDFKLFEMLYVYIIF